MVQARLKKLLTTNWHFIGVILFFVIHGYSEHQGLIPFHELLLLLTILLVAGLLLYGIGKKIFKADAEKAGLFTSFVFVLVLFFGVIQDFLNTFNLFSLIGRLIIFFPLCLLAIGGLLIWLRKTRLRFVKPVLLINSLLSIYILLDLSMITQHFLALSSDKKNTALEKYGLTNCDTCTRVPVYLVLLDTYLGSDGLKEYYQYDNTAFETSLRKQGFHITAGTHSNYIFTIFSMASTLNMQYLGNVGSPVIKNHYAYNAAVSTFHNNMVCRYFESQGYQIVNYSIFDIKDVPAGYRSGLLPDNVKLITQQTMYYRVSKYLPLFLERNGWAPGTAKKVHDDFEMNNEQMMNATLSDARKKQDKPTFTYLHLMMPHGPFIFDSTGKRMPPFTEVKNIDKQYIDEAFLQYLVYTNKRISTFLNELKAATGSKAVIILMSDHGYQVAGRKERSLAYQNLNAVYIPDKRYEGWYNGMTNVNQFRVLFNTLFHQSLPMLKDSIVY